MTKTLWLSLDEMVISLTLCKFHAPAAGGTDRHSSDVQIVDLG